MTTAIRNNIRVDLTPAEEAEIRASQFGPWSDAKKDAAFTATVERRFSDDMNYIVAAFRLLLKDRNDMAQALTDIQTAIADPANSTMAQIKAAVNAVTIPPQYSFQQFKNAVITRRAN